MEHSITFISAADYTNDVRLRRNTWDDWHLIPTSRPVFNPPPMKKEYVEIPGSSESLDLSEALTGFPLYQNREGSIEFIVENGHRQWYNAYSGIMDFLHGRKVRAVLNDDLQHYYEGRFFVNQWKSDPHWSVITLDYDLSPYKLRAQTSTERWLWNPFDFENGVIQTDYFKDIHVQSMHYSEYHDFGEWTAVKNKETSIRKRALIGMKPVCPTFVVTSASVYGITVHFINKELGIDTEKTFKMGSTTDPDIVFSNVSLDNRIGAYFKGYGTISIDFRSGGF